VFSRLVAEAAEKHKFLVLLSLRSDFYPAFQNDTAIFELSEKVDDPARSRQETSQTAIIYCQI
jgi:hypothetical protein